MNATDTGDHEDEVHIHAPGKVEIRVMDKQSPTAERPVWHGSNDSNGMRRVRHWLKSNSGGQ